MADYWKMYALLHGAVLKALDKMEPCEPAWLVLKEAVEDVEAVYAQTREAQEEA